MGESLRLLLNNSSFSNVQYYVDVTFQKCAREMSTTWSIPMFCVFSNLTVSYKNSRKVISTVHRRNLSIWTFRSLERARPLLKQHAFSRDLQVRNYGMIIARVLRGALKIRYLVLGGAVSGGVTLNKVTFNKFMIHKSGIAFYICDATFLSESMLHFF